MKKFIHETGRIRMEDEHMATLTAYLLISKGSNRTHYASLTWG